MAREWFPRTSGPVVLALLVALGMALLFGVLPAPVALAQAPTVNGLIYGDGDIDVYELVGYAPPVAPSTRQGSVMYKKVVGNELYIAVAEDRSINDNVIGDKKGGVDDIYFESAGWKPGPEHSFNDLRQSDNMQFSVTCGNDTTYTWQQDYIYQNPGPPPTWLSDVSGPDGSGSGTGPPGLVSASSMQWNMNNTLWDYTLGGTRTSGDDWKSPVGASGYVTDEIGYPPEGVQWTDAITFQTDVLWSWPIIYELKFDLTTCPLPLEVLVVNTHNSPSKGAEDNPMAVDLTSFEAAITVRWETASEVDNLGFNLWRAEAIDGDKVQINEELIPTLVPPGSPFGAEYSYTDTTAQAGVGYYYWLESVEVGSSIPSYGLNLEGPVGPIYLPMVVSDW